MRTSAAAHEAVSGSFETCRLPFPSVIFLPVSVLAIPMIVALGYLDARREAHENQT